jgi:phosphoglycerol transferase MdoB-like AlkP superfamily enzyme
MKIPLHKNEKERSFSKEFGVDGLEPSVKNKKSHSKSAFKIFQKILLSAFLLLLNFAIIRGSFSMFPLGLPYAEVSPNAFINKTAINAFYTLEDAATVRGQESGIDYIEKAGYKDNIRAAFADYLGKDISQIPKDSPENSLIVSIPFNRDIEEMRPNVILIVMESFGSDLIKYQSAQFDILGSLKKHFDSDLLFMNFLPQHSVTIGSLESIITGIARKPRSAYLSQSKYVYNDYDFYGLKNYKERNYETLFFYGGNLGWRQLEPFMTSLGFDEVFGEGSMPSHFERNQWGVFDGYLFDFVFERFTKDDKRKFALILTMTNHPPFSLPKNYKAGSLKAPQTLEKRVLNKETAQKRYETYSYSADLLGRFIEKIKNSKYGENTIIAVTGDHNFWGLFQYEDGELLDSAGVPFYLYIPKKIKPEGKIDISVFGSHIDIMPTLYAVSLSNAKVMQMGRNLLSKNASENIASQDTGIIMDKKYAVSYNFDLGDAAYFVSDKNNGRKVVRSDEKEGHLRLIKHYLSQTAIADYLIKNTGKQRAKK